MGKASARKMVLKNDQWPLTLHLATFGLRLGCVILQKKRECVPFCSENSLWLRRIMWMCLKGIEVYGWVKRTKWWALLMGSLFLYGRQAIKTLLFCHRQQHCQRVLITFFHIKIASVPNYIYEVICDKVIIVLALLFELLSPIIIYALLAV